MNSKSAERIVGEIQEKLGGRDYLHSLTQVAFLVARYMCPRCHWRLSRGRKASEVLCDQCFNFMRTLDAEIAIEKANEKDRQDAKGGR